MADIFDIDFSFQNKQIISPEKRLPKNLDLCNAITDSLQELRDLIFGDFKTGSSAADYDNGTAYVIYDRVKWEDMGVYELQVATSTGVDPTGEALSTTNWRKVLDNFLGADERMAYNARIIVIGYAINRWFGVTTDPYIYITNNNAAGIGFTLNFPAAVYTALGSTAGNREERVDQFIAKFVPSGMNYAIVTY